MPSFPAAVVDAILTTQLQVAWAGESGRLGWWNSRLVDPDAGLDLLGRIAPRTAAWAGWELVRAAATQVDAERRAPLAEGDRLITLFHQGAELDEALEDRLRGLKLAGGSLPGLPAADAPFDRAALVALLSQGAPVATEARTAGRKIQGETPVGPEVRVKRLAAALVPLADHYPMPHFGP